jgi:hypothetical protein
VFDPLDPYFPWCDACQRRNLSPIGIDRREMTGRQVDHIDEAQRLLTKAEEMLDRNSKNGVLAVEADVLVRMAHVHAKLYAARMAYAASIHQADVALRLS